MAPEQQTPTSIIFLDVDGVLNSRASREASETDLPDSACLDRLKRIVKATGSAIVLSSTWRFSADDERAIETALHLAGIGPLYGATPHWGAVGSAESRGAEILRWLVSSAPSSVVAWLALDDLDIAGWCAGVDEAHFELTHDAVGLDDANVEAAIAKLGLQQARHAEHAAEAAARITAARTDSSWLPLERRARLEELLQEAVRWSVVGTHEKSLSVRCADFLLTVDESAPRPPTVPGPAPPLISASKADVASLAKALSEGLNVASLHRGIEPLRVIAAHLRGEDPATMVPPLSAGPISHGPMIQIVGTTATIWARGTAAGSMRVRCWRAKPPDVSSNSKPPRQRRSYAEHGGWSLAPSHVASAMLRASSDFTTRCSLEGLRPATHYDFVVETGEGPLRSGSFRTPPPSTPAGAPSSSFNGSTASSSPTGACSFVFGSCVGGQGYGRIAEGGGDVSGSGGFPVFARMLETRPDFFMCNGDAIYADNAIDSVATQPWISGREHIAAEGMGSATDLDGFRARYQYHYDDPKLSAFYARVPIFATWDDHEILDDWGGQKLVEQGDAELLEAGMRAWFEYNVHAGPPEEPRRVYRAARWGPHVELLILDCRTYRAAHDPDLTATSTSTPQMRTMLGAAQLEWLTTSLSQSTATWKFICTSVPLSYPTGWPRPAETGFDGWADGAQGESVGPEAELKAILKLISDQRIVNVVFISGDVHFPFMISYDPFGAGKPLVHEIGATPLHALCLPAPPKGPGDTSLNPSLLYAGPGSFGSADQNFGRCAIDAEGAATFTLHDAASGSQLYELQLTPE